MDPGSPERLDRVDVPDAGDRPLIEEQHLDRGTRPAAQKRTEPRDREATREGFLSQRRV
jgi:hypothetical protein